MALVKVNERTADNIVVSFIHSLDTRPHNIIRNEKYI